MPMSTYSVRKLLKAINVSIILAFVISFSYQVTSATYLSHESEVANFCSEDFLRLSDEEIYNESTEGKSIGGCYIRRTKLPGGQDQHFVITDSVGSNDSRGWPRDSSGFGTGQVHTKSVKRSCIYMRKQFNNWPIPERQEMCSPSTTANAARQLRHAIKNNQCGVRSPCSQYSESLEFNAANITLRTLPYNCKTDFVNLDPFYLFELGFHRLTGGCYISINKGGGFCDLYVISATVGASGYRGWPRSYDNRGTGCVKAPDFPKRRNICWYTMWNYYNWPLSQRLKMCASSFGEENAAEQLRHAIVNDQCMLPC